MRKPEKASDDCNVSVGQVSDSPYLSVTDCAKIMGYSRDRFYDLKRLGVFPEPAHRMGGRPAYHRDQVEVCRQVVRTSIGFNGKPVWLRKPCPRSAVPKHPADTQRIDALVEKLGYLGCPCDRQQVERLYAEMPPTLRSGDQQDCLKHLLAKLRTAPP